MGSSPVYSGNELTILLSAYSLDLASVSCYLGRRENRRDMTETGEEFLFRHVLFQKLIFISFVYIITATASG